MEILLTLNLLIYLQVSHHHCIHSIHCVNMFMVCLHTTFHTPNYSDSLVITIKLKLKKISACLHEQKFNFFLGPEVSGASGARFACVMHMHSSSVLMLVMGT